MYRLKSINELIKEDIFSHFNADGHLVVDLKDDPQVIIPEAILNVIELTGEKNSIRQKYPTFEILPSGSYYCEEAGITMADRYESMFVNYRIDNLGLLFVDYSEITAL